MAITTVEIAATYRRHAILITGQLDRPPSGISSNGRYGDWFIYLPYWACTQFAENCSPLEVPSGDGSSVFLNVDAPHSHRARCAIPRERVSFVQGRRVLMRVLRVSRAELAECIP